MARSRSTSVRLAALAGLALGIAGCTTTTGPTGAVYPDFAAAPATIVHVATQRDTLAVRIDARTGAVAAPELQRIGAFIARLAADRPEAVHAEIRGAGSRAHLQPLFDALVAAGVAAGKITIAPAAPGAPAAPAGAQEVTVAATRATAIMPACPGWPAMDAAPNDNRVHPNFGCADASNLAAMVADPSDLVTGEAAGSADGERAAAAVSAYRADKIKPLPTVNAMQPLSVQGGTNP
jgi:pilus assembly protein CpaD